MTATNPPGLMLPTQKSYTPGAGNPRDSAMMSIQNMNNKQANLNASVSGGSRRRKRVGGAAPQKIEAPQIPMLYQPQGGNGTNPNNQIASNSSRSMQSTSWAANDNQATIVTPPAKIGGTRRKKRGGVNPNWSWGCYSGGRKRSYRNKNNKMDKKKSKRRSRR